MWITFFNGLGLEPSLRKQIKGQEEVSKKEPESDYVNPFPQDADDEDFQASSEEEEKSEKSEESDEESDDEKLFEEYERIKKEREEEQKKKVWSSFLDKSNIFPIE